MAEPDQIDFNILAHGTWGVIEGCEITVSGSQASTLGGWCVINNSVQRLKQSEVNVGSGGSEDRFDLIVANTAGVIDRVKGDPAVDPVFPDPPLDTTVLAAVFAPAGVSALSDNVIDKRRFVTKKLLTKIPLNHSLLRNLVETNGDGTVELSGAVLSEGQDIFQILGNGTHSWFEDTYLSRSAPKTLRIQDYLTVDETISARRATLINNLTAGGTLEGSNLIVGSSTPTSAHMGAIWQDWDSGRVYVRRGGRWQELATTESGIPVGTVIMSLEPPGIMEDLGWVAFGSTISEIPKYAALFQVGALAKYIHTGNPRTMHLPDATGHVLMAGGQGVLGGSIGGLGEPNTDNKVTLKLNHMPKHGHDPRTVADGAASPKASMTRSGDHAHAVTGGAHNHPVNDPGHAHNGMDFYGHASPVIVKMDGATNKLDALFNDSNHTHSVEALEWTMKNTTKITIGEAGSAHAHQLEKNGDHEHKITVTDIPNHTHEVKETERGQDDPFDITPKFLTVRLYVRS